MTIFSKTNLGLAAITIIPLSLAAFLAFGRPSDVLDAQEPVMRSFVSTFAETQTVNETSKEAQSSHKDWWLNSGGRFSIAGGVARTLQGKLPVDDVWRAIYGHLNPTDTYYGFQPQNIFRLLTRSTWTDFTQEVYAKINSYNATTSPERKESNGIFLFNRYADGDNLYYTGIRVDGQAVIKKKYKGTYYHMASKQIFPGTYEHEKNSNLLPRTRLGLKSEVLTLDDGRVRIRLYVDKDNTKQWQFALEVFDDGTSYGGPALTSAGRAGLRTDFMDVEFDDYRLTSL